MKYSHSDDIRSLTSNPRTEFVFMGFLVCPVVKHLKFFSEVGADNRTIAVLKLLTNLEEIGTFRF